MEKQIARLNDLIEARFENPALAPMPAEPAPPALNLAANDRGRILAVDDDADYLRALAPLLVDAGFALELAYSGEEALQRLQKLQIDCVLLDSHLPGLSGVEVCAQVRSQPGLRDLPVVMLTSNEGRDAMIAAIDAGADDFIAKSADFQVLRARLNAQVRRRHFEEEHRRMREELLARQAEAIHANMKASLLKDLERKNEDLEAARLQAEQESQFKSKFLANMSHELRTPLNAIIGFSELLEQELFGPLNDQQKSYLSHVLVSGRHLLSLINDVLDLSKIEAGRVELTKERMAVRDVVHLVGDGVKPLAEKKGIALSLEIDEGLPELVADRLRLNQILYNLLSNGIKFTPDGGSVVLRAQQRGQSLIISVKDTGIGIKQADMPRLFREFERIGWGHGDKSEGTGLGLVLTKRLVEMHGGTISVQSEPGEGSVFTVQLPFAPRERPRPRVRTN